MTEKTYAKMARDAEKLIAFGKGAILDGTFIRRAQRQRMFRLAEKHRLPLLMIHCSAVEETTQQRLLERAAQGRDVSDGRWEIYIQQKNNFEALDEIPPSRLLEVTTDAPVETLAGTCEKFLRSKLGRKVEDLFRDG